MASNNAKRITTNYKSYILMQTYSNILMAMQASATCLYKECSSTITYNISFELVQHLSEKTIILLQTVQNLCESRKAFL